MNMNQLIIILLFVTCFMFGWCCATEFAIYRIKKYGKEKNSKKEIEEKSFGEEINPISQFKGDHG